MKGKKQDAELTFIEHLEELRQRIIICLLVLILGTAIGFGFAKNVLAFLTRPFHQNLSGKEDSALRIIVQPDGTLKIADSQVKNFYEKDLKEISKIIFEFQQAKGNTMRFLSIGEDQKSQFYYFSPLDPILLQFKAALILGILLSLPIWLWHLWRFIQPALTEAENRVVQPVLLAALVLFPVGAGFAYFFAQYALVFFSRYTFPGLEPRIEIFKYLNFLLTMMISLGLIFEAPLIIMLLARLGIVNSRLLGRWRRYIYVGIFIIAAVLAPGDGFTMIILTIPLILLFELSLWLIKPFEHRQLRT
ncbi:MAG: twin-arginine translocase subunit TatC [Candidatus Sumerlaeia bacterium]|nr:twin-arginine translocase subunit TatC [Candidatus Sumerlaeia bacterium]